MKHNRIFIPGSEWLYFKIYTGTKNVDVILMTYISKFLSYLLRNKYIEKCFYLRYSDPDMHIRLRLKMVNIYYYTNVFEYFYKVFNKVIEKKIVMNIQCDTYIRELERYGTNTIDVVESIFYMDTILNLKILKVLSKDSNKELTKSLLAIKLIDFYLTQFNYVLEEKIAFCTKYCNNYQNEFNFNGHSYTSQLNNKYRLYKIIINESLKEKSIYSKIIEKEFKKCKYEIEVINDYNKTCRLEMEMDDFVSSIIHMSLNRFFTSQNRQNEMISYYMLNKFYQQKKAQSNFK